MSDPVPPVIALSMTPPQDLLRMGFLAREFDQLTFELCLRIVRRGARICHGGHLGQDSILIPVADYLAGAFQPRADSPRPLLHVFNQADLSRSDFDSLRDTLNRMRSISETWVPLVDGTSFTLSITEELNPQSGDYVPVMQVEPEGAGPEKMRTAEAWDDFLAGLPAATEREALTTMRMAQVKFVAARICVGGKRGDRGVDKSKDCYSGRYPGIYEEALLSLEAKHPTVMLGGYGGAARDVAVDLSLIAEADRVPFLGEPMAGTVGARDQVKQLSGAIPDDWQDTLADFADRDDTETLAHNCVDWIIKTIG